MILVTLAGSVPAALRLSAILPEVGWKPRRARVHEDHVASRLEQQRAGLELGLFALDHGAKQGLELFGLGIGKQREVEQERAIAYHGHIIGALLEA